VVRPKRVHRPIWDLRTPGLIAEKMALENSLAQYTGLDQGDEFQCIIKYELEIRGRGSTKQLSTDGGLNGPTEWRRPRLSGTLNKGFKPTATV